jgi:uncharacterized protein YndB with AHSA1/START domain/predicted enzyme related to lactoylglutathione lyase
MSTNVATPVTLRVTRLIKAPRERVFAAWTTPEEIMKWFGPETCQILSAKVDLRVGGKYHFRVKGTDCESGKEMGERDLRGTYREVKRPSRLVYTWGWQGDPDVELGETVVTVDFLDKEGFTEVQITHDGFPNTEARDKHNYGWNGCLDRLQKFAAGDSSAGACSEPGAFCWNELLAADVDVAAKFYTRLFGWQTEAFPGPMKYTMFTQNGQKVGGFMAQPNPKAPPQWLPYIEVESVDASAKKAGELGANILMPPMDIPTVGRLAVFADPQGATVGVFQPARK